jgi:hypothetical protein
MVIVNESSRIISVKNCGFSSFKGSSTLELRAVLKDSVMRDQSCSNLGVSFFSQKRGYVSAMSL